MANQSFIVGCWFLLCLLASGQAAGAVLTVHAQTAVDVELVGYDGLAEVSLFKEAIRSGEIQEVATPYQGLALLRFVEGQNYHVLLGDVSFTLNIAGPAEPPTFAGSVENEAFASRLTGKDPDAPLSGFALLMLQAKELLDSSSAIRTTSELAAKKQEFLAFVRDYYEHLSHSDMVRRLIAQYFMMHEYVDYHTQGAPATDIKSKYQQAVLDGVDGWLETLRPYIPAHEVLNYCVSLYYQRSMVTMASVIAYKYQDIAFCPGIKKEGLKLPHDVRVTNASKNGEMQLRNIRGDKVIAFVSVECPVSMVETVIKARELADQKEVAKIIVAPLQQLSETHLAMNRMVAGNNMFFIDDEQWRNEYLTEKIRLPLFVKHEDGH